METLSTVLKKTISQLSEQQDTIFTFPQNLNELLSTEEIEAAAYRGIMSQYHEKDQEIRKKRYWDSLENYTPYPVFSGVEHYRAYLLAKAEEKAETEDWKYQVDFSGHLNTLFLELSAYFGGYPELCTKIKPNHRMIIITGPVGTGKSQLMQLLSQNPKQSFHIRTANRIRQEAREKDQLATVMKQYSGHQKTIGPEANYFNQKQIGLMIDDLGTEQILNDYGNQTNVMAEILQERYHNLRSHPNIHTILVTNMTLAQIGEKYDIRVFDRLKERAVIFEIPEQTKSFRA